MEKSTWVKIVWLGAIVAIPAAVIAVQKPAPPRAAETHRVIAFDRPVSVDISDRQIEGAPPTEAVAAGSAEAAKPRAMRLGAEKITMDSLPSVKEQTLTSILAPVAGPKASPSP